MKAKVVSCCLLLSLLIGCSGQSQSTTTPIQPTATLIPASITPEPTKTAVPPTATRQPENTETPLLTSTAPPPRNPPLTLPYGLEIEEYQISAEFDSIGNWGIRLDDINAVESAARSRHSNTGKQYVSAGGPEGPDPAGGIINGKLFHAEEVGGNDYHVKIRAALDGEEIFLTDCGHVTPDPSVITAWVYKQHWIIQGYCHEKFDIFWDGVSLNASKGYQSSFAFQILGQYPFYLFERDNKVWLSYHGQPVLLGYDEVPVNYCCELSSMGPFNYENLITFYAFKDKQAFYVVIGVAAK